MAEQLLIGPTRASVKVRSPWAAALLPFITLGIYHLVWWYRINRELRDVGQGRGVDLGQNPTNSLLALFPGALIIIPPFVSYWRGTKRVIGVARLTGTEPVNGWIALILFIVIQPAYWAYVQSSLNQAWRAAARDELTPMADRAGTAPGGEQASAASGVTAGDTDPNSTAVPDERNPFLDAPAPADHDAPAHEPGGEPTTRRD